MFIIDEVYKKVLSYLVKKENKEASIYDINEFLGDEHKWLWGENLC